MFFSAGLLNQLSIIGAGCDFAHRQNVYACFPQRTNNSKVAAFVS
jgi:hypothetical protein